MKKIRVESKSFVCVGMHVDRWKKLGAALEKDSGGIIRRLLKVYLQV